MPSRIFQHTIRTIDPSTTPSSHEILSTTHTDSAASTVSRGSLIYGNATPAWAELNVGAAGTLLRSDGTDAAWATTATAGLASGTGANTQVTFWTGTSTIAGDAGFTYISATNNAVLGGGLIVNEDGGSATTDDFRVESNLQTHAIFVDASADFVGIWEDVPQSLLHVTASDGGLGAPETGVVIVAQRNGAAGDGCIIQITSGGSGKSIINLGDASDPDIGALEYDNATDSMRFATSAGNNMFLSSTGSLGINTSSTAPAGRIEATGSGGNTNCILRQTSEVVANGAEIVMADGAIGAAIAATNLMTRIQSSITQATPSTLMSDLTFAINTGDTETEMMSLLPAAGVVVNDPGNAVTDFRVESDSNTHMIFVDAGANSVLIGGEADITPAAELTVLQDSTTGARPCLELDQDDTDVEFIEFDGASAGDASANITTLTTGAQTGMLRVTVNGATRWIPFVTTPA